jgi:hypothetical protein
VIAKTPKGFAMKALPTALAFWNRRSNSTNFVGTELSKADLLQVVGGSPKGGWGTKDPQTEQTTSSVDSPKGGWGA